MNLETTTQTSQTSLKDKWPLNVALTLANIRRAGVLAALIIFVLLIASRAFGMGAPSSWQNAQAGLGYPLYAPTATIGLTKSGFQLLSCGTGQDESVAATYGGAYRTPSSFGSVRGFSIGEGYPQICSNPGTAKPVGTKTVNGAKIRISVYCNPASFASCTAASGKTNGYVLQWRQRSATAGKSTQMFLDSSKLTLAQTLKIAAGFKRV
jgi:hypothetical protein